MAARNMKKVAVSVLALGAATAAVVFGSFAGWTAQTTNPGNSITTGQLLLNNSKDTTAAITVTGLKPGQSGSDTVVLSNPAGGLPLDLHLTQSSVSQTASNFLKINIFDGTSCVYPAGPGACAGYAAFDGSATLNGTPVIGSLAALGSKTYTIGYTLDSASTNADMNKVNTFNLTWTGTPS
ncbi:MAG: hypothetical protein JWM86_496 [Thermoleophilia bacterium]|nr:hypothetical protein [Thermoleophilia bacterium]